VVSECNQSWLLMMIVSMVSECNQSWLLMMIVSMESECNQLWLLMMIVPMILSSSVTTTDDTLIP
jgi:hypothetical protein